MRQVACSGSLPPRWVTKSFSACGVITTRRARHASPGQKQKIARRRRPPCLPLHLRLRLRLALQPRRTRAHARAHAARVRYREATLHPSFEPGAKRSQLEPRTGSTTAAGGSCKGIKGSA